MTRSDRRTTHTQIKGTGNLVTAYEFDAVGNRLALIDAKGQRMTYDYDALNRETLATYPDVANPYLVLKTIATAYDANNNPANITETKQGTTPIVDSTTLQYDTLDRVIQTTQRGKTLSYAYDPNGNRTRVTASGGETTYSFDQRNRLITANASGQTTKYITPTAP